MRRTASSRFGVLTTGASSAVALALLLGLAATTTPAEADKVGVAAAVNPDAFSSLDGSPKSQLNIGKSIFYNERINTTGSGLVQVLLVDGSTFTVGPGSDLVIDKFVYDPDKKAGKVVASFSKGVVRYVGGKISKNEDAVKINTPTGALAIRGGMFQGKIGGGSTIFSFLFGKEMIFTGNNGKVFTVYQPGYTLDLSSGKPVIRPTTAEDIRIVMAALTRGGRWAGNGNSGKSGYGPGHKSSINFNPDDIINSYTQTQIQDTLQNEAKNDITPPPPPPPPPPPETDGRVVIPGSGESDGRFQLIDGRLQGSVTNGDSTTSYNLPYTFTTGSCDQDGVCAVTDGTITTGGTPTNYVGTAVIKGSLTDGFFAYQLTPGSPGDGPRTQTLLFGGSGYTLANSTLYTFKLTPDVLVNSGIPFASADTIPAAASQNASVSPLLLVTHDAGNPESQSVWMQASFYADMGDHTGENGSNGGTFINVAIGTLGEDGGLVGAHRGASTDGENSTSLGGAIGSLAGPEGQFLGGGSGTGNPNVVIESSTSANGSEGSTDTYHVGVGTGSQAAPAKDSTTMTGFAAGLGHSGSGSPDLLGNLKPGDVSLSLDANSNTMSASMQLGDGLLQNPKYNLNFGGGNGNSAFIDNNTFAALEGSGSTVNETVHSGFLGLHTENYTYDANAQSFMVSADAINANAVLFAGQTVPADPQTPDGPQVQKQAFCQSCDFLKWGAWGSHATYTDHNGNQQTEDVNTGWWIVGNVVSKQDMPTRGSASYSGDVIGTVSNNGEQYVATGDMSMGWNFGKRAGTLAIDNFDGRSFGGVLIADRNTPQQFNGGLVGRGIVGLANGAFVGSPGPGLTPQGVIGNFGITGANNYQATGIFGGTLGLPH